MSEIVDSQALPLISYSQNGEDIVLWRALLSVKHGFYIDVGANHPIENSATQLFYEREWSGINVEPLEDYYLLLNQHRQRDINLQIAISDTSSLKTFYRIEKDDCGLSTLNPDLAKTYLGRQYKIEELTVKTITLTELLNEHQPKDIHFLKIDVEGEEKSVLKGLDLQRYRPWIIVIESISPDSRIKNYSDWESLLLNNRYSFVFFDGLNRFYLSQEHQEIKELIYAANILDGFLPFKFLQKETDLKDKIKKLESQNLVLQTHIKYLENPLHSCIYKLKNFMRECKIIVKLIKFVGILFLKYLLILIKSVPFFKKIAKEIVKHSPGLSKFYRKIENLGGFPLLLTALHKSPKLTKTAKFVYFKFPGFSRFLLKVFGVGQRDPADLELAIKGKETSKLIQEEIEIFYKDLKFILDGNNKI